MGMKVLLGNGGVFTELRAVGNKGHEGGVADERTVPDMNLKLGMTPPRGESMGVGHVAFEGGRVGPVNFSYLRAGLYGILRRLSD